MDLHLQPRYEHRAQKLTLIFMQALYLDIEYRIGIERKAVVFGQKLCKIVFIEALYLVDPALNIDIFGIVEKADEFFGLC